MKSNCEQIANAFDPRMITHSRRAFVIKTKKPHGLFLKKMAIYSAQSIFGREHVKLDQQTAKIAEPNQAKNGHCFKRYAQIPALLFHT